MGSTAIPWEIHSPSNPDDSAYLAASRAASTVASVVPPARPHRTPNLSFAKVLFLPDLTILACVHFSLDQIRQLMMRQGIGISRKGGA
jgi:hypothetical protein